MRISKKERKENALRFYHSFMNRNCNKAAIAVQRCQSSNPNIQRCQFWAVPSCLAHMSEPVIIAESNFGIDGCFTEFLESCNNGYEPLEKKSYWDNDFNDWLESIYGFRIIYQDGLVFMLEREEDEE